MADKQIENLYKIKDLCCEKIKFCNKACFNCISHCTENEILILVNEVLNGTNP